MCTRWKTNMSITRNSRKQNKSKKHWMRRHDKRHLMLAHSILSKQERTSLRRHPNKKWKKFEHLPGILQTGLLFTPFRLGAPNDIGRSDWKLRRKTKVGMGSIGYWENGTLRLTRRMLCCNHHHFSRWLARNEFQISYFACKKFCIMALIFCLLVLASCFLTASKSIIVLPVFQMMKNS